ncbi:MAG: glycoside hydrolase family 65 protein, partial [Rhodanobacteraceae bacterium]
VRTETATNNAGYLLATSAGFVQNFLYGLSGLRINDNGLDAEYAPILPPDWKSVTLRDISFRGKHYDVTIGRGANGKAELARKEL